LLVVIAIIAILIGLLFPAFSAIQNQAKKTQAKNDLTQIVTAVNAFYTEYGKYPLPTGTIIDTTYGPAGAANEVLFRELRACTLTQPSCPNAASVNTRQIVYISPRVLGTAPVRSGIASDNGQFYDPWGTPYNVRIDGDYNNSTVNPYGAQAVGGAGPDPVPQGVIAWSLGKNGRLGGGPQISAGFGDEGGTPGVYSGSGDLISWQ
jgi:type II secretory pathway pseudopilin PulG